MSYLPSAQVGLCGGVKGWKAGGGPQASGVKCTTQYKGSRRRFEKGVLQNHGFVAPPSLEIRRYICRFCRQKRF